MIVSVLHLLLVWLLAMLLNPGLFQRAKEGFSGDTFHHLSSAGQFGLVLLTLGLSAIALTSIWWIIPRIVQKANGLSRPSWTDAIVYLLGVTAIYWVVISVVPQIYYSFYKLLIPGLPSQWVANNLLSPSKFFNSFRLATNASLSEQCVGSLGWVLLLNTAWQLMLHPYHFQNRSDPE